MGFFSNDDEVDNEIFYIYDKQLTCNVCGHERFLRGKAQLNTGLLTLLNLDWLNRSALYFECKKCGHLHWFRPQ